MPFTFASAAFQCIYYTPTVASTFPVFPFFLVNAGKRTFLLSSRVRQCNANRFPFLVDYNGEIRLIAFVGLLSQKNSISIRVLKFCSRPPISIVTIPYRPLIQTTTRLNIEEYFSKSSAISLSYLTFF